MGIANSALLLGLALASASAFAQGVCRQVDESGRVTYTDRRAGEQCAPVKMHTPTNPSRNEYEAARMRAESDRLHYQVMQYEDRQRRPIVTYDPNGLQRPPPRYLYRAPGVNIRRDPNLPDVPPPGSEPRYYYDGR